MKRFSAITLCLKTLRNEGWCAENVERRYGGFTHDFLGAFDVLAWRPMPLRAEDVRRLQETGLRISPLEWIGIQVTTRPNLQEHLARLSANDRIVPRWLKLGLRVQVWLYPSRSEREEGDTEPDRVEYTGGGTENEAERLKAERKHGDCS